MASRKRRNEELSSDDEEVMRERPFADSDDSDSSVDSVDSDDSGDSGDSNSDVSIEDPNVDGDEEDEDGMYEEIVEEDDEDEDLGDEQLSRTKLDDDYEEDSSEDEDAKEVWRPGVDKLEEGEKLEYSNKAYKVLYKMTPEWPCLSFDILKDTLGDNRQQYPLTAYVATGTQAPNAKDNSIMLMKVSSLYKTQNDSDSESDDEDEEDEDGFGSDAVLEHRKIACSTQTNRLRCQPQNASIVAAWGADGAVRVWNLQANIESLERKSVFSSAAKVKPFYTMKEHKTEGFAIDWSPVREGRLLTGDCDSKIHLSESHESSMHCVTSGKPFNGHTASVEDIQWSPKESEVFASSSVDKTVRIWDARNRDRAQITIKAHDSDVNVISWNRITKHLIASGSDDGTFSIWDLRMLKAAQGKDIEPAAHFNYHKKAITSIEWCPHDSTVLAVASEDDQVTIWDMSIERDEEVEAPQQPSLAQKKKQNASNNNAKAYLDQLPPQLLFIHMGQHNVKEVHWHKQIPGMLISTAEDGFDFFKPMNM
eukprot:GEZU01017688.1.p1 GENE.GEZU01017688.1~~GEZU01017688.1.p1  ORF type:complete len:536 (+),score=172.17 GEZU01017688.1:78-1685(+)